jgi:hypothetical protein
MLYQIQTKQKNTLWAECVTCLISKHGGKNNNHWGFEWLVKTLTTVTLAVAQLAP